MILVSREAGNLYVDDVLYLATLDLYAQVTGLTWEANAARQDVLTITTHHRTWTCLMGERYLVVFPSPDDLVDEIEATRESFGS